MDRTCHRLPSRLKRVDTIFLFDGSDLSQVELYRIYDAGNGGFRVVAAIPATDDDPAVPQMIEDGTQNNFELTNANDANLRPLDELRAVLARRSVRGDRLGLADATVLPEEATFFADREGSVWDLENQQYQRQPDKTGQVQRITRDSSGRTTAVAPESTANTNLNVISIQRDTHLLVTGMRYLSMSLLLLLQQ